MKNIKKSLRSVFCALLAAAALAASLPAYAVSQAEIDDLQKKLDALEQQAQEQQDARHLSKNAFETTLSGWDGVKCPVEDAAIRTSGLKICGEPLRGWMHKVKTCSPSVTARN